MRIRLTIELRMTTAKHIECFRTDSWIPNVQSLIAYLSDMQVTTASLGICVSIYKRQKYQLIKLQA